MGQQQKYIQKLFDKPMDRRQFLAHIGAGILAVMGVGGLIKGLVEFGAHSTRHSINGYGSSPYGGDFKK